MAFNSSSRTVNATKNAVSAIANKILILMLTLISRKFFINYIGIGYLGINGLFGNILTLLSMADLGLGTAMNVSLYKPIAENDTRKITALINYFKTIYRFIAIGVTVVGLSLLPFLKYLVNMNQDIPYLYLFYVVFVCKNAFSYLLVYKSSVLYADQKNYIINRIDVITGVIRIALQIIIIVCFKNYLAYIVIDALSVIAKNICVSIRANKDYDFLNNDDSLNQFERKSIFSDISSVFLYKIAWSLLNGTDNILISVLVGTICVGLYSNYYTVTSNVELFIGLLFTSLTASIGNLVATATAEARYKTFKTMQMISFWLCGFVVISLFFLLQDFIQLWLGKDYLLDHLTLIAIIINVYFSICMRPVWTFREGTGMYKQIRYIMFVTAILNLIFSIVLGKFLGISGIIFATSISKLCTYFWYEPNILFKNFFDRSPKEYYLKYVENIGLVFVSLFICNIPIHFIQNISIFNCLIKAIMVFIIVNSLYFLLYRKTEEFQYLLSRVTGILKRTKNK